MKLTEQYANNVYESYKKTGDLIQLLDDVSECSGKLGRMGSYNRILFMNHLKSLLRKKND